MQQIQKWGKQNFGLVLAVVLLIPSVLWIWLDKSLWWWDQSWYGEVALNIVHGFQHNLRAGVHEMLIAFHIKAPLIAWFEALFIPLGGVLRHINATLLTALLAIQGAALWLFWKVLWNATKDRIASLLGVLLLASAPLFLALVHQNFVEPLQIFTVVWALYVIQKAPTWPRLRIALHLCALLTVGVMIKITTPLFIFIPMLVTVWWILQTPHRESLKEHFSKPWNSIAWGILVVFGIFSLGWYTRNAREILAFALSNTTGSIGAHYGTSAGFGQKIWFWLEQTGTVFFTPFTWVVLPFVVAAGVAYVLHRKKHTVNFQKMLTTNLVAISLISFISIIALFSIQVNSLARFLLPTFPYIALIIACALTKFPQRAWRFILLAAVLLQACVLNAFTLRLISYTYNVSRVDFLQPYESDASIAERMANIVRATCNDVTAKGISIFGIDAAIFNANAASFVAAKTAQVSGSPACKYSTIGWAQTNEEVGWKRFTDLHAPYYVTLDPEKFKDLYGGTFNEVSLNILQRVQHSNQFERVSFSDPNVLLYKNLAETKK